MIYFGEKLPYQIKNNNGVNNFLIEFDDFRNNDKKNNLEGIFW